MPTIVEQHYLFSEVHVRQRFEKMLKYATAAIEGMEDAEVLSCDVDATATVLVDPYRFEFPKLNEGGITTSTAPPRQLTPLAQYVTHFFIPFSGEREILRTQPITPPSSPPIGRLDQAEIRISFVDLAPDSTRIGGQFDQALSTIRRYLEALKRETDKGFEQLSSQIKDLLVHRRGQLERAGQVAKNLGYPLRRRSDDSGMAVPLVRKTILAVAPPRAPKPVAMEPHIEDAIYDEILNVLASMSLLIERNPTTFEHIQEPALRDHFLLQLNGQFEGKAAGETFNGAGKTDILLRELDKNLFIAECKFWDGPQSLVDAINQLFGYLTWRDSKAAILLFSRRKDFSRTIEQAREALGRHPQFRGMRASTRETSFRASVARPDDEQRRIDLTVMLFNMPSGASGS